MELSLLHSLCQAMECDWHFECFVTPFIFLMMMLYGPRFQRRGLNYSVTDNILLSIPNNVLPLQLDVTSESFIKYLFMNSDSQ